MARRVVVAVEVVAMGEGAVHLVATERQIGTGDAEAGPVPAAVVSVAAKLHALALVGSAHTGRTAAIALGGVA